ncbi:CoF synthetase [Muricauda sp. ANG21]|uniref:CoF synthetase n=1 Tax=Allomuricauda sp. ANG21 TaxID=3042468 RepID=UPI003454C9E9
MLLSHLRNQFFWFLDLAKGRQLSSELQKIQQCIEHPGSKESLQLKRANLAQLIAHASTTTPYYCEFNEQSTLEEFPVIKKTTIQQNFDLFQSSIYKGKDNYEVATSGSTGVPFFLFQDQGKRLRNRADVIFFLNQAGYQVGNRLYELEVWRNHNLRSKWRNWLQNSVQFDISRLTEARIIEFLDLLKADKQKDKILLGFASALEQIAQYLEKKKIYLNNFDIKAIIANSEYLNPYTKTTLGKHLNTKVLSRYSSEEIGIIAQQTLQSPNHFLLNQASYIVELLKFDNDQPVEPGEFGRIVVTDLFNYAMPIIRYDTGDIAKKGVKDDGTMLLDEIEGRKMDLIYDTEGNIISSFVVYTKFHKYYQLLKQYQFIQQGAKEYEVKLNVQGKDFEFETELIEDIKSDFGQNATVTITYVDEIPALASGKRRKVVNNYK